MSGIVTKNTSADIEIVTTVSPDAGGAVGVESRKWFVAIVNNNTEKSVQEKLAKIGYETYVAKQLVIRVWKNGKKAKVDKVLLPSLVFIKCTEAERKIVVTLPYINRFMTNRAGGSGNSATKPLAVIPQKEIDTLRFMLGQSDVPVSFVDTRYRVNDKVTIVRGSLQGLEGEVVESENGKSEVIVRIDILGCAKVVIDTTDIEPVKIG